MAKQTFGSGIRQKLLQTIGVPTPDELKRAPHPWQKSDLMSKRTILRIGPSGLLAEVLPGAITDLNAPFDLSFNASGGAYETLIYDATGFASVKDLQDLFEGCRLHLQHLSKHARIVIIARDPEYTTDPLAKAVQQGVEGFMRTLSKEIGKKGSTANLLYMAPALLDYPSVAKRHLVPMLHFLLSERSAYVNAQPLRLSAHVPMPKAVPLHQPLKGKVALVTGGARGIGAAVTKTLAREGADVVVVDLPSNKEYAEALTAPINGRCILMDITQPDAAERLRSYFTSPSDKAVNSEPIGIDIIVHNAGVALDKTIKKMSNEQWQVSLAVNLAAILQINEQLLPILNNEGRVITLSSISGLGGNFGQANYTTAKAALIGLSAALGKQPELLDRAISFNAVAPGFIETRMTSKMPRMSKEVGQRMNNLSQAGQPIDVAELITFLCSPGAASISGQTVRVCGGNWLGA